MPVPTTDSELTQYRRKRLRILLVLCVLAIPVGFAFSKRNPETAAIVSVLGALGVVVAAVKLAMLPKG